MSVTKLPLPFIVSALLLSHLAIAEPKPDTDNVQSTIAGFKSNEDAISYAIGASIGRNFKKDGFTIDKALLEQGLNDGLTGTQLKMSEKEFKSVLAGFQG